MRTNIEVETFVGMNFFMCKMPLIVVYEKPLDFPNEFIARLFDLDKATDFIVRGTNEIDIITKIPGAFTRVARHPADDSRIVCVYV